jgi:cytidylate kinase
MKAVAIARQYGSGGTRVAEIAAERLGYRLVDQAVVNEVARRAGISTARVAEAEKLFGDTLLDFFHEIFYSSMSIRHIPGIQSEFDEKRYRKFLVKAIEDIAASQSVVFLGRAAAVILADNPGVLRVQLVAREEDRVAMLMRNYKLDGAKAEQIARVEEKKRVNFLESFEKGDPVDPCMYHLVLNTSALTYEEAADVICHVAGTKM